MAKKYYCKIKGIISAPMTLVELKKMANEGKLQPFDKVASDISTEFVEAGSVSFLNEIFKFQNYNAVDDAVANNEEYQGGFAQGVNLRLLEKNSIEIVKLLRNIYGWMNFYFYAGMVVAFITILAALANNKNR